MSDFSTVVVITACVVAAATDVWCYRIFNVLTIPLCLAGLVYGLTLSGWWGLAASLAGTAVGFAALIGLYLAGGMGAGDVKLMAGLGAWLGPVMISHVVLASCAIGGLYALGLVTWNGIRCHAPGTLARGVLPPTRGTGPAGDDLVQLACSPVARRQLIPYGVVILAGLVASLAHANAPL